MMKVASQRSSTRTGFRPMSPILSQWFPDAFLQNITVFEKEVVFR